MLLRRFSTMNIIAPMVKVQLQWGEGFSHSLSVKLPRQLQCSVLMQAYFQPNTVFFVFVEKKPSQNAGFIDFQTILLTTSNLSVSILLFQLMHKISDIIFNFENTTFWTIISKFFVKVCAVLTVLTRQRRSQHPKFSRTPRATRAACLKLTNKTFQNNFKRNIFIIARLSRNKTIYLHGRWGNNKRLTPTSLFVGKYMQAPKC